MDDSDLQQRLLSKLSEYGDSLLEEDRNAKKKKTSTKQMKSKPHPSHDSDHQLLNLKQSLSTKDSLSTAKSKKKKKKLSDNKSNDIPRTKAAKDGMDFEEELRLFKEEQLEKARLEEEAEETERREGGGTMKRPPPEVIVFKDPSRRKKKRVKEADQTAEADEGKFNLKKARYEVRQFGLSGFSFEDREKCEADRAVTLGAWAPKREYINYKEFTSIQKSKKEQARQQREMDRKMGYSVAKKPTTEKIRIRNQGFWRDPTQDKKFFIDGQIGRYKQGVQVVSKNDIANVKSSRGKRSSRTSKIKF